MTGQSLPQPARGTVSAQLPACHDGVCVTCSDVAVPVRIRALLGDGLAVVDTGAGPEEVSIALVDAAPGDLVLVHAKEAIAVLEKAADTPARTPSPEKSP